jgi:hypothetical protein
MLIVSFSVSVVLAQATLAMYACESAQRHTPGSPPEPRRATALNE